MPPPQVFETPNSNVSASRSPSVTLAAGSSQHDVIVLWCSSNAVSAITVPTDWSNPLGGNTVSASSVHTQCCVYHRVTMAEVTGATLTFSPTNLWNANVTGNVVCAQVRGVDPYIPIDSAASIFNSTTSTTHVLVGLTGVNMYTDSLIMSAVCSSVGGTYTNPANWGSWVENGTNCAHRVLEKTARSVAGTDVANTNITVAPTGRASSITLALSEARPNPKSLQLTAAVRRAGFY